MLNMLIYWHNGHVKIDIYVKILAQTQLYYYEAKYFEMI